ncbi:formimidoylglutamate deiminase [Stagnihabitans tardus]|uniref:Formimidoylglutamate deiminase n=1 Tax=Stagnihabitans tardus TaxID=2699202 RepID=A0AAE4Y7Y7_9RHOB|nr:formimidoylglutamate deiminase [Stagnihabitans tardus]NBZ87556.1 formimidoylglutamate deiminase [Stagnihabitans tardus]
MRIAAKEALLPEGWARDVVVEVEGGRIVSVGHGTGASVDVLLPAPVNLHSHAFQRAMAGLTEYRTAGQDSFWTWRSLMYRFLERLTPEDVEVIAAQVMVEMAEAGYAAVAEFHYLHHGLGGQTYSDLSEMAGRIAQASRETGLGLTLLPVLYERGGCDNRALQGGQLRFGNDLDSFVALHEASARHLTRADDRLGAAPHSLRAVRAESLAHLPRGPVHIHVAEQVAEVEEVSAFMGARPVEWVLDHGANRDWCLIHATQMTPQETEGLARSGAVAGLCPITEANLGDGIFDGARYLSHGGAFGIGSDSNIRISLSEEIRMLEYSQRLGGKARAVLADQRSVGRVIFEGMVKGGAQAAGRQSGAIRVGDWADLLALDASGPDMAGRQGDRLLDTFAFAGDDRMVSDLWSAGRHIVTGGRHIARDAVRARFAAVMARLSEAL